MKYFLVVGFLATLLGGCATLDRWGQEADQRTCDGFGFQRGTEAYSNCMMQQAAQHSEENQRTLDRQKRDEAKTKR